MANFETGKPATSEMEDATEKVSARLEKIKSTQIGDLSPAELMLLAGERQALAERKEEAAMDRTYEEALGENVEYDAKKTAEKEAQEKQRAEDMAQEQADKDKATALAERIKDGNVGETTETVVETEAQKLAKKELAEKYPDIEVSTSENFPGSILVKEKKGKDKDKVYSVREEDGEIVGNASVVMKDGWLGATQQLHDDDRAILEKHGVRDILQRVQQMKPDSFEDLRMEEQAKELEQKNDNDLLYAIDSFAGDHQYMGSKELREYVSGMNPEAQKRVAEKLLDSYRKEGEVGLKRLVEHGYKAYLELRGTPFSDRFRELEDERLVSEGFGHFRL